MKRPRVLFFAEAVTLAHLTRPSVLARALAATHRVALARAEVARPRLPGAIGEGGRLGRGVGGRGGDHRSIVAPAGARTDAPTQRRPTRLPSR